MVSNNFDCIWAIKWKRVIYRTNLLSFCMRMLQFDVNESRFCETAGKLM